MIHPPPYSFPYPVRAGSRVPVPALTAVQRDISLRYAEMESLRTGHVMISSSGSCPVSHTLLS
jgi:hypothetical protein